MSYSLGANRTSIQPIRAASIMSATDEPGGCAATTLAESGEDETILRWRLGLADHVEREPDPGMVALPVICARIRAVQPGLTWAGRHGGLARNPVARAAGSPRELFSVPTDTAVSDGSVLRIVISE